METQTKETQNKLTPQKALTYLKEGNQRFVDNKKLGRDLLNQVVETSTGQYPFAVILGCIDSRVPIEIVFDQGVGDVFSTRVAGSVINEDVLGSLEYSCKVAGSKVIIVLGHSKCGAVTAACKDVELGNITALLSKIKPAVDQIKSTSDSIVNDDFVDKVIHENTKHSIDRIRKESPILAEMEANNEIEIVGAYYDVNTGVVEFYS